MNVLEIKNKTDNILELMQGCLPAVGNLPNNETDLILELIRLAKILHNTADKLAGYAGYLRSIRR